MTHLTHCPVKTGAFAMTPTQPSATHRAMGHANRLTLPQNLWQDAVHALRVGAR